MLRFLLIFSLALSLFACGVTPKTHLYVLNSEQGLPSQENGLAVGVWKVKLPELLDRSEIVTRSGQYEIELADFHHWAGRLGPNIDALTAQELSKHLDTVNVRTSPWNSQKINDYQVKTFIERFDGKLGGEAVVSGSWVLLNGKGSKQLTRQSFSLKAPLTSDKYSDLVAVLSKLTSQLSQLIAEEIERVSQQNNK